MWGKPPAARARAPPRLDPPITRGRAHVPEKLIGVNKRAPFDKLDVIQSTFIWFVTCD